MLDLKEMFPEQIKSPCLVEEVYYNSRDVKPNTVFVALKGMSVDGHDFLEAAFENGAKVAIVETVDETVKGLQVIVPDTHLALSNISARLYKRVNPLQFIGVTGTDGKTSTAVLISELLGRLGKKVGYIGTNGIVYGKQNYNLHCTTPLPPELFKILKDMSEAKMEIVSMEVSSHALANKRVADIFYDYAVFTNFSRDHLDFHKTIAEYEQAKLQLFHQLTPKGTAIINIDDAVALDFVKAAGNKRILTFSLKDKTADFYANEVFYELDSMHFTLHYQEQRFPLQIKLIGEFNIYNSLVAIIIALEYGYTILEIKRELAMIEPIPGRMELFYHPTRKFSAIVDFGHAPNAIKNVLVISRLLATRKVTIVTGAVGDGDRKKRPLMAANAIEYADKVIFTTDQPYSENPVDIIAEMVEGIVPDKYRIIIDRETAIKTALDEAEEGQVVVIMGRGRETEIIGKDYVIPLSDYEFVKEYMEI